ncbi:PREDICTED: uncharacterized protein LOC104773211 [Camelina sativa]|uniref:Uncharacterized protein LOC104773211 n=1 Tax=Camelina sativa TaxID=90675 RepID=A0ABM0Y623_CAMSA|nr:PREDICTED: uncharacterized protein LOC104773211 [Camelina sativa]
MREYETEFNQLKRYGGHEQVEIRRFRPRWRMSSLTKLVEKAAMLEDGLAKESQQHSEGTSVQQVPQVNSKHCTRSKHTAGRKPAGKASGSVRVSPTYHKRHLGQYRHLLGTCLVCGGKDHMTSSCPQKGNDTQVCYQRGQSGHIRPNCPKLATQGQKWVSEVLSLPPPLKRSEIMPRVYSIADGQVEASTSRQIIGTILMGGVETHVMFDTGATHCFVSPYMIGKGRFQKEPGDNFGLVQAAGGQVMMTYRVVRNISVMMCGMDMPEDLVICRMKSHDVILSMDWLGHQANLGDFVGLSITGQTDDQNGCEAYIGFITIEEEGSEMGLQDIPVVREFESVFRPMSGLPPARSGPFTIELEPSTAPISKALYRMAPAEMAELKK